MSETEMTRGNADLSLVEAEGFLLADLYELAAGTKRRRIYDGPGGTVILRLDGESVTSAVVERPGGERIVVTEPTLEELDEVVL